MRTAQTLRRCLKLDPFTQPHSAFPDCAVPPIVTYKNFTRLRLRPRFSYPMADRTITAQNANRWSHIICRLNSVISSHSPQDISVRYDDQ